MTPPIRPEPVPLEQLLAEQANAAIQAGKDPAAVTEHLHQVIGHLRANPDFAAQGQAALDAGKDPDAIGQYISQQYMAQRPGAGAGRDFGSEPTTPYETGPMEYMAGSVPFVNKATALANAGVDKLRGNAPSFWQDYDQRLESLQAGGKQFEKAHPASLMHPSTWEAPALSVAGNAIPAIATLGGSTEAQGGGALMKILKGADVGMKFGAAQGLSEAHSSGTAPRMSDYKNEVGKDAALGLVSGGVLSGLGQAGVGALRKAGAPDVVSNVAQGLANRSQPNTALQRALTRTADALGTRGRAVSKLAPRIQEDAESGFTPSDAPKGVPLLPIDQAGPSVRGQAEGIVSNTGPGRGILTGSLDERGQQMRPDLERAYNQSTGTTPQSGENLLRGLADEKSNIENVTRINQDAEFPKAPTNDPLKAWSDLNGGNLENGVAAHEALVKQKNAVAKQMFGAAREATKGQPVESATLDAVRQTPAGSLAYDWALAQKANRQSPLAQSIVPPAGMDAETFAHGNELAARRGLPPIPGDTKELPDPETLHYMKQRLATLARLGVHDGQGGTLSTQAQGALGLFRQIRNELPDIWKQADDATAAQFRLIDANNMGRDLMRTQLNPSGNKALHTSMDAVERRLGEMAPEEQQAARVGMQSAITDHLRSGNVSAKGLAAQLQEPSSAMARRVALATGDNSAPQRLAQSLGLQYQGPVAPTVPAPSSEGKAAGLGLDIFAHRTSAPSSAPSRSLAVLDQSKAAMSPVEQRQLQQGAAQAVRGKMQRTPDTSLPKLFSKTPELARQVQEAFPSPQAADEFGNRAAFWGRAQSLKDQLTGNSRTAVRGAEAAASAEQSAGQSAVKQALTGHPRQALGTLISQQETASQRAQREKIDAIVARMLTTPGRSLSDAVAADRLRRALGAGAAQFVPSVGGLASTSNR